MRKSVGIIIIVLLGLSLALAACGDNTNTAPVATSGAGAGAVSTTSSTTSKEMTTAANSNAGSMPGMTMAPGQAMNNSTPGTASASTTDAMTESLKGLSGKDFEIKFMQDMAAHHQEAVQMAQLIATHTTRPELIKLGQDIVNSQTKEISDMTGWLASWFSEKPLSDPMSAPGMMEMMSGMSQLMNSKDAEFDKLFLQMMIPHHQGAVSMSNLLPSKTQRPELLALGQNIIKAQTAEIAQMQGWLKSWFGTGA